MFLPSCKVNLIPFISVLRPAVFSRSVYPARDHQLDITRPLCDFSHKIPSARLDAATRVIRHLCKDPAIYGKHMRESSHL